MRFCRAFFRVIISLVLAFIINAAFFFAVPVLNALLTEKGEKKAPALSELTEVEVNVQEKKREVQQKILRQVVQPNNFKANRSSDASRARGFKMDLSLARDGAGEGVSIDAESAENVVYEAGEVDEEARLLREIPPVYPERAKKMGLSGYVKVFLVIDSYGNIASAEVVSEDPPGYGFGNEALRAVRQWKFEPAKLKTFPVSQKATKEFRFAL